MCLITLCVISSCKKNDDKSPENSFSDFKLAYSATITQDMIDYADVSFTYYDAEGNQQTETVTTTQWTKSISITKSPIKAGIKLNSKRNTAKITKDNFDTRCTISCNLLYKKNSTDQNPSAVCGKSFGSHTTGIKAGYEEQVVSTNLNLADGSSTAAQFSFSKDSIGAASEVDF